MWQETSASSRRSRSTKFSTRKKERSTSYSSHPSQIRRLYTSIEAIEAPHLEALRSRSPCTATRDRYRGTLGGCEPIMIQEEKHLRVTAPEEEKIDTLIPAKAAKLLDCYSDVAPRGSASKYCSERIPVSTTEVRSSNWRLEQNLYATPLDTPAVGEFFELEGEYNPLIIRHKKQSIAELAATPVFSSVSWSGEDRHELPATPTTPKDWNLSQKPRSLRLSKSSICVLSTPHPFHHLWMDDIRTARDTVEIGPRYRKSLPSMHQEQPRTKTICTPPLISYPRARSQGLRKVKAHYDLRIPAPNLHQTRFPSITITNPTPGWNAAKGEKATEAGVQSSPVITDVPRESRRWEEITEAADLKVCMAVLAKEIARRRMEMRS